MITDTSAIVLKTIAFRESSLIVTLLSEMHGKTAVMARGARRNKNIFGGMLQPGAVLDVTYYYKPTRDVQNLSSVTQKQPTWRIHQEMERMAVGLMTLELCEQLCHEHEPMPEVFEFLENFLSWLHKTEDNPKNIFPYVQYRLAQLTGIGIAEEGSDNPVIYDSEPDSAESRCFLNVSSGRFTHSREEGLCFPLTKSQQHYIRCILNGRKSLVLTENFPATDIRNLIHHLDAYFQYHMEGIKERKSDAIFEQII